MYIAVTGFCGTGSSAVLDILKEYDNCSLALGDNYEHNVMFVPDGLFDLEDKLLKNNDPFRSDEAIRSFIAAMDNLYYNDYGWFGSYQRILGAEFKEAVDAFVDTISDRGGTEWYGRYQRTRFSFVVWMAQVVLSVINGKTWVRKGKLDIIDKKSPIYTSYISEDEFFAAARILIQKYLNMCNQDNKGHLLFDHLLWPQNIGRMDRYFPEEFRLIVVIRDPRDVYFSAKHLWKKYYKVDIIPSDVGAFIKLYKFLYCGIAKENDRVKVVKFEDLIYDYDNAVKDILEFTGMSNVSHDRTKEFFNPEKSLENTQIFKADFVNQEECAMIEKELPDLLYSFPMEKQWNPSKSFV